MLIKYSLSKTKQLSCGGESPCPASCSSWVKFASVTYRLISMLMDKEKENFSIVYKRCEKCKKKALFSPDRSVGDFVTNFSSRKKQNQHKQNKNQKTPTTLNQKNPHNLDSLPFAVSDSMAGFCLLFCATFGEVLHIQFYCLAVIQG